MLFHFLFAMAGLGHSIGKSQQIHKQHSIGCSLVSEAGREKQTIFQVHAAEHNVSATLQDLPYISIVSAVIMSTTICISADKINLWDLVPGLVNTELCVTKNKRRLTNVLLPLHKTVQNVATNCEAFSYKENILIYCTLPGKMNHPCIILLWKESAVLCNLNK